MSLIRYYLPETVNNNVMFYIGQARCFMQYYINNTFSANEIVPGIFVGDLASASNSDAMKEQGITQILSIFNGSYEIFPEVFEYKLIHINDDTWVSIDEHFEECNLFIDYVMSKPDQKVMIHCQRGVSRSVTLLVAYLLWKKNTDSQIEEDKIDEVIVTVLKEIKAHRPIAEPNDGFIQCLKRYICRLNGYPNPPAPESMEDPVEPDAHNE